MQKLHTTYINDMWKAEAGYIEAEILKPVLSWHTETYALLNVEMSTNRTNTYYPINIYQAAHENFTSSFNVLAQLICIV